MAEDKIIDLKSVEKCSRNAVFCFMEYTTKISKEKRFPNLYVPKYTPHDLSFFISKADGNHKTAEDHWASKHDGEGEIEEGWMSVLGDKKATLYFFNGNLDLAKEYLIKTINAIKSNIAEDEGYGSGDYDSQEEFEAVKEGRLDNIYLYEKQINHKEKIYEILSKSKDEFLKCPNFSKHKTDLENYVLYSPVSMELLFHETAIMLAGKSEDS